MRHVYRGLAWEDIHGEDMLKNATVYVRHCMQFLLAKAVCMKTGSMKDDTAEQIVAKSQMALKAILESLAWVMKVLENHRTILFRAFM